MKSTILLTLSALALLTGCSQNPKTYEQMDAGERIAYLQSQVYQAVLLQCSNDVPGIKSVANPTLVADSGAVVAWRSVPAIDYVNHQGGIERTNLHLKFLAGSTGKLIATEDFEFYDQQYKQERAAKNIAVGLNADGTVPATFPDGQRH